MFRKAICFLILASMVLHCASRMNVLSYLYQQRHTIAYHVGLIAEIPIAICGSEYDFGKGLTLETHDEDPSMPPLHFQAHEIILFFDTKNSSGTDLVPAFKNVTAHTPYQQEFYSSPAQGIFQPPKI